ncbi:MAG: hypothetical protein AB1Z18_09695 [Desulfobacterales bacterium]
MIWHPLQLTALAALFIGLLLLTAAAVKAFRIVIGWNPASADRAQISLEIEAEAAVVMARWALWITLFSIVLMILGITNVFPALIPGAMCGTGVMQAMSPAGTGFLILNFILLGILLFWNTLEKLGRRRPDYPLARLGARLLLLALPVAVLAFVQSVSAAFEVDTHRPVDCCAIVYDQYRTLSEAQSVSGFSDGFWLTAWGSLSVLLLFLGLLVRRSATALTLKWNGLLAATAAIWVPVAAITLTDILSAYHYGVLQHRCPWCLFLLQHRAVGFPLFGALAVIGFESLTAFLLPAVVKNDPQMLPSAFDRSRIAAGRIIVALFVFLILTALPPLFWQLRFSVWIDG